MKKIFIITQIIIIVCISCDCVRQTRPEPRRGYYEGYIYTLEGQPIQGLKVYPSDCKFFRCTEADSAGGITDERGFFKFEQAKHWMTNGLVVESDGRIIDTIGCSSFSGGVNCAILPWPWPQPKYTVYHSFTDATADTFFVDMDCKWKSNTVLQGRERATKRVLRKSVVLANCLDSAAEPSFGTFTDARDGQTYKTVTIDGQTWMAQNLNYETSSSVSWCYEDNADNCNKYGRLYDWETAKQVCPKGWKLPEDEDWKKLIKTACGYEFAGKTLRAKSGWNTTYEGNVVNGTDIFGFSALPGGYRDTDGGFENIGKTGNWWTATMADPWGDHARYLSMRSYDIDEIIESYDSRTRVWHSVRCVADRP